jgi:hypothetical protein
MLPDVPRVSSESGTHVPRLGRRFAGCPRLGQCLLLRTKSQCAFCHINPGNPWSCQRPCGYGRYVKKSLHTHDVTNWFTQRKHDIDEVICAIECCPGHTKYIQLDMGPHGGQELSTARYQKHVLQKKVYMLHSRAEHGVQS